MNNYKTSIFSTVVVLLVACLAVQANGSEQTNSTVSTDGISGKTYFKAVGITNPVSIKTKSTKQESELETRKAIMEFVWKRTHLTPEKKVNLDAVPKKFRYTDQYQQMVKEAQRAEHDHRDKLKSYHKELDLLANKFRMHEERTSSGVWKLTFYYFGFNANLNKDATKQWDDYINNFKLWADNYPQSPTPHILIAQALIQRAWAHRGSMIARDVKPESWKPFRYFIDQAKKYLETNKDIASEDPHWYALMSTIARAQGWDLPKYLTLMEEGTSRYPYYYQTYFNGIQYLLPRWHGSREKMEAFANAAVEKTRKQDKMGMYARVYWVIGQSCCRHKLTSETNVDWKKMRQGMFDILKQYPDQWNYNNFAYFACMAKDKETTKKLTEKVQIPIRGVWVEKEVYEVCKDWANGKDSGVLEKIIGSK